MSSKPCIAVLAGLLAAASVHTQNVAFDVASIRPSTRGTSPGLLAAENGTLRVTGYPLRSLVQFGWNLRDFQVVGGPAWASSEGFEVAAKGDSSATDAQLRLMVQALLTERFQLKVHSEERQLPIYALVIGKDGHKLRPADDAARPNVSGNSGLIVAQKISVLNLARLLSPRLDRPVIDRTGLDGRYDFRLQWALEPGPAAGAADTSAPSLFTAIQEQLGLKLEVQKGPVQVMVIDSAQRPSEN
ncbi:MAG: TIGR03435 family protein [Vicinamibacterales bacterium]